MFKKVFGVLILALALVGVGGAAYTAAPHKAEASVDSWSGHTEVLLPYSGAITANAAPALIYTAVSTVRPNIRALVITNTASGLVTIYDGSGGAGSSIIFCAGVIANTPLVLDEDRLGIGIRATLGNGFYVSGATGTITLTARVRKDTN